MLLRLYDLMSFVRAAFTSIGSALSAKTAVEIAPATTGRAMFIAVLPSSCGVDRVEQNLRI